MQTLKRTESMSNFIAVLYSTLVYYYMIEIFHFETQCFFLGSKRSIVIAKGLGLGFLKKSPFFVMFHDPFTLKDPIKWLRLSRVRYKVWFTHTKKKKVKKKVNCRLHAFQEAVISLDLEKKKSATLGLVFLEMSKVLKGNLIRKT